MAPPQRLARRLPDGFATEIAITRDNRNAYVASCSGIIVLTL